MRRRDLARMVMAVFPVLPLVLAPSTVEPDAPYGPAPVLAVYGDSYSGHGFGADLETGWVLRVARSLGMDAADNAVSGAGYAVFNPNAPTFPYQVATAPVPNASVVVVMGSLNDRGQPAEAVREAAVVCFRLIRVNSPNARLLVIGPIWPNATPDASMYATRDAVKSAALQAGATFVDPLAEQWFAGRPDLIGPDGFHPNVVGWQYLADKIRPHVAAFLPVGTTQ